MKQRFNALDLQAALYELKACFTGCRVTNIYDVDHKTYLIKLGKPDSKAVILIESGIRIHCTEYDWPKNLIPSGFSMKLRKHLRSRRLENVCQVGADRIVDMQFGSGEAAYHLIVELYDRGNILLTDFEYTIIFVLRPRTDQDSDVKFAVREKYPFHLAKQQEELTKEKLVEIFSNAKDKDDIKKVLTFNLSFGAPLIEHCLTRAKFPDKCLIGKDFNKDTDIDKLHSALSEGQDIVHKLSNQICKGYIIQKKTKSVKIDKTKGIEDEEILTYDEFHPYLFQKYESSNYIEFESFDKAVDEFFSKLESQKLELKELNQNKEAVKKLENVKKDHQKRIEELKQSQTEDELKARLIEYNLDLVDKAIFLVNNAIANQLDWKEINEIIEDAKEGNHTVALAIKELKLEINHILLELHDPEYEDEDEDEDDNEDEIKLVRTVEIDLGLNAFKNSRRYYEMKKYSIVKEQKTIDAGDKALKSAEKKTYELLKQASKTKLISKSRKPFWFEKFYWFISSENYLIIGGRDQQQNEIVVKKYLKAGDLYVHADVQGASSVVIKNPSGNPVPPKTLNEAGCMAVCYSVAWEAKVLTNAYWVYNNQVSKQAPTGEYLSTGSFMIRGKKNFIPQTALVFGFGLMYKLDDESVFRHKNDRKIKTQEEEMASELRELNTEFDDVVIEEEPDNYNDNDDDTSIKNEKINDGSKVNKEKDEKENNEQQLKENKNKKEIVEEEFANKIEDESTNLFPETSFQIKLVSNINLEDKSKSSSLNKNKYESKDRKTTESGEEQEENDNSDNDEDENDNDNDVNDDENDNNEKQEEKQETTFEIEKETNKSSKSKQQQQEQKAQSKNVKKSDTKNSTNQSQFKRGQKSRFNKMKSKYKDQDDEDRQIVMQYLAPAGKSANKTDEKSIKTTDNNNKKSKQQNEVLNNKKTNIKNQTANKKNNEFVKTFDSGIVNESSSTPSSSKDKESNINDEIDAEEDNLQDELDIIDSLTGNPYDEDELLFCLTVCAPYTTLQNYKHKVKLIPGTTKRGQAVKTAIEMFTRDKVTTQREKDLIKSNLSSKEQDTTRNLPGKVKVSAPNLMKLKKK